MSGLDLRKMEAGDMLDVLHYMFEEDMRQSFDGESELKSKQRVRIYELLYNTEFRYAHQPQSDEPFDPESYDYGSDTQYNDVPVNPATRVQGYTPPTIPNPDSPLPFGDILDAPLG